MRIEKPSLKISVLTVISFFFVASVMAFSIYKDNSAPEKTEFERDQEFLSLEIRDEFPDSSRDSDKDGLQDWEEGLWGTDLLNKDTDGDGVNDGVEVARGTNPGIPGPDDSLTDSERNVYTNKYGEQIGNIENLNSTEAIMQLAYTKATGEDLNDNPELQKEIIKLGGEEVRKSAEIKTPYFANDLNVYVGNDVGVTKSFANQIAAEYLKMFISMVKEKPEGFTDIAKIYKETSEKFIEIPVPVDLVEDFLIFSNNLYINYEGFLSIQDYENDPLRALVAVRQMKEADEKNTELLTSFGEYFKENDIIFNDKDSAKYLWNF